MVGLINFSIALAAISLVVIVAVMMTRPDPDQGPPSILPMAPVPEISKNSKPVVRPAATSPVTTTTVAVRPVQTEAKIDRLPNPPVLPPVESPPAARVAPVQKPLSTQVEAAKTRPAVQSRQSQIKTIITKPGDPVRITLAQDIAIGDIVRNPLRGSVRGGDRKRFREESATFPSSLYGNKTVSWTWWRPISKPIRGVLVVGPWINQTPDMFWTDGSITAAVQDEDLLVIIPTIQSDREDVCNPKRYYTEPQSGWLDEAAQSIRTIITRCGRDPNLPWLGIGESAGGSFLLNLAKRADSRFFGMILRGAGGPEGDSWLPKAYRMWMYTVGDQNHAVAAAAQHGDPSRSFWYPGMPMWGFREMNVNFRHCTGEAARLRTGPAISSLLEACRNGTPMKGQDWWRLPVDPPWFTAQTPWDTMLMIDELIGKVLLAQHTAHTDVAIPDSLSCVVRHGRAQIGEVSREALITVRPTPMQRPQIVLWRSVGLSDDLESTLDALNLGDLGLHAVVILLKGERPVLPTGAFDGAYADAWHFVEADCRIEETPQTQRVIRFDFTRPVDADLPYAVRFSGDQKAGPLRRRTAMIEAMGRLVLSDPAVVSK